MYERFTDRARKVMQLANEEAMRFNHEYIGTEHILLALVNEGAGVAANVLKNLDIDLRKVRLEVEKIVQSGPDIVRMGKLHQTPRAKKVIEYSIEEARNLNHKYVGTEHLLLGLLREQEGVAAQVLMNLGLKLVEVRKEVLNMLGCVEPATEKPNSDVVDHNSDVVDHNFASRDFVSPPKEKDQDHDLSQIVAKTLIATEKERIRYLEQQLWNVRLLLGAIVGTFAGGLLWGHVGAVSGLIIGGAIAVLGLRILSALAAGSMGLFLSLAYLDGSIIGALVGAVIGYLIAEIGDSPIRRRLLDLWRRK